MNIFIFVSIQSILTPSQCEAVVGLDTLDFQRVNIKK